MQNFQALGAPPLNPRAPGGLGICPQTPNSLRRWGINPQTPKTAPPQLRIPDYAPDTLCNVYNYMGLGSFCFEQFLLDRPVANLVMLTVAVCLMLNCFLVEKFYFHYALCDFDFILLHCTELLIRQSIDREKNFDVTFEPPPPIEKSCVRHC